MKKEEFIRKLLSQMTVREKVGQLNQCGNSIYNDDYKTGWELLREGRIGSFLGIADAEKANEIQRVAVEETRLGIPVLLGYDVIHGFEILNEAVTRVLELKYDLGLFENPYKDIKIAKKSVLTEENRSLALEAAEKSVVLLKNNGVLPLQLSHETCVVTGVFADEKAEMLGAWSGPGKAENMITPAEALKLPVAHTAEECKKFRTVIVFMGEPRDMNGEGKSRTSNTIPQDQMEYLCSLRKSADQLVTVVTGGRPLVLTEVCELSDAVLFSGALGCEAGNAYREILSGAFNPCGKLVNTFPTVVGQTPLYYNMNQTGKPPVEEFFWTSKYMDAPILPLFPFGYGLSYTRFSYNNLTVSDEAPCIGDIITVRVQVTNCGAYDGSEVVQLYIRDEVASMTRPIKELKGYHKES